MNKNEKKFLIYLLGPTAIGKSKLSLHLSEKLNCHIINSDAFSFYKGANLMTAKVSIEEQSRVKHHFLDFLELDHCDYNIQLYQKESVLLINQLIEHTNLLVVGGSNYYVDSILFERIQKEDKNNLVKTNNTEGKLNIINEFVDKTLNQISIIKSCNKENINLELKDYTDKFSNEDAMLLLKNIDPKYSNFLHKNDERRVKNCLLYYFINNEQKSKSIENEIKTLRNKDSKIIFLIPDKFEDLTEKIFKRIEEMVSSGIKEIFNIYEKLKTKINFEKGILQAIGYKEFYPLILLINQDEKLKHKLDILISNEATSEEILKFLKLDDKLNNCLEECKIQLKFNTNNYAKSQLKFISKKIIPNINKDNLLELKVTNSNYEENLKLIFNFLVNKNYDPLEISTNLDNNILDYWKTYFCDKCEKELKGICAYETHMKSRKHKNYKKKK